jgi:signal transduction histidine kinase/CheY-like chemotaxis protein
VVNVSFLDGGGELGGLMRAHDWSATPLGPPGRWPQSLRTAVRLMLNTGHPMYIFWGAEGACLYNDAYRQSIGPERHPGSLGRPAREVWDEIWDTIGPQIEQVMSGRGATWHENQLLPITRNGRRETVYWTYSYGPIDDRAAATGVGGVLVVCTETTQQVLSARRSAEELERFAALFGQAPTFMAMLRGPDHRFERANPGYLRLIGHRQILGRSVAEALPDAAAQGYVDLLDGVYRSGEAYTANGAKYAVQTIPGGPATERYVDFVFQPIKDAIGAITGIFVVGADVTERALAEAALRESEARLREANETLEANVKARTRELMVAEEALRQSHKMEAVGQLTGGLAHDFNNLLTGISGNLELLQARLAQGRHDRVDRYLSAARGATQRAAALTQRLLAFSRRQTLDPKATDVNRLVMGMKELIRGSVGPRVAVEVVGAPGLWSTLVDPPQLENALLNLCINARDAMPDGGRITIETANKWLDDRAASERQVSPGEYVSLCVTDTGAGMTREVIERAFDPFFTTKPLGAGTGLGLSMVYGFVRQSGGQVRIHSEVGVGTTVCLYIPRHKGKAAPGEAAVPSFSAVSRSGKVVLVIDDEPTVRTLAAEVIQEAGYTAIEAVDGVAGLKILESGVRVDMLVTDVGLPGGLNGRQVADAGRVLRSGLKVLFITGYAENAVVGDGHLALDMEVMTKPFAMDALAKKIRDMVEG